MLFILLAFDPCVFHTYLVFVLSSIELIPQELFHCMLKRMFLTCQQKKNQTQTIKLKSQIFAWVTPGGLEIS